MRELFRLIDVKFVIIAFTLLLQEHDFVMGSGNKAAEFSARVCKIATSAGQVVAGLLNGLALSLELGLKLAET